MKLKKSKIAVIAALLFSVPVWIATGCAGHPAYKLKSGESSKVRLIEKDGKLVHLEVKQDGVTEIASDTKSDIKPEPKTEDKPETKAKPESERKSEAKDKSGEKTKSESENKSKAKNKTKKKDKPAAKGKSDKKDELKVTEKQKPKKSKKKVWVPAVYKVVKHPAKKKQEISVHWVCQCGEVFYSDEEWQAHRPKP